MRDIIFRLALILIIIGIIAFFLAQSRLQYYETFEGSLLRVGNSAEDKSYQLWQSVRIWSIAAGGFSYVMMALLAWMSVKTEGRVSTIKRWRSPTLPLINICSNCGAVNSPRARFCKKCSAKIEP